MDIQLICSMLLVCFLVQNSAGISFKLSDIFASVNTVISGVSDTVLKSIPTPAEISSMSIELLVGFPEASIFQTVGMLCSMYMSAQTIQPLILPDIEKMSLQLHKSCDITSFPLNKAGKFLESPDFDVNKTLVVFATGWLAHPDHQYVTDMAKAYNCRGGSNFLVLNTADFIDTLYTWSAFNTEAVGRHLAAGLEQLAKKVPADNIHLIGHSLGAHIVGYAGRYFTENTGIILKRITGLDPANPCFYEGHILSGLQRGDAQFIDIIHTNTGSLGKLDSIGDADFYPDGKNVVKPGCVMFPCSHIRAVEYYIESVYPGNEYNFMSGRCTSLAELNRDYCRGRRFPMGYAVPHNLKGDYYLAVNGQQPFGKSSKNWNAVPSQCQQF